MMIKMRQLSRIFILVIFFALSIFLLAQSQLNPQKKGENAKASVKTVAANDNGVKKNAKQPSPPTSKEKDKEELVRRDWLSIIIALGSFVVALVSFIVGVYSSYRQQRRLEEYAKLEKFAKLETEIEFLKRQKEESDLKKNEEAYCNALKEKLGNIQMVGIPGVEVKPVRLDDIFVNLRMSGLLRTENRFAPDKKTLDFESEPFLTPKDVMSQAFKDYRLLLIVGDPGYGKTTLLKYYAVSCLGKNEKTKSEFGLNEDILPIYIQLRELQYENDEPISLTENLANWSEKHLRAKISVEQYNVWLQNRKTLVMMDGLDEIISEDKLKKVLQWIKSLCQDSRFKNALFVVTSRASGYFKSYKKEFALKYCMRVDILDFSFPQQETFLRKWFQAAFLFEPPPINLTENEWKLQQKVRADQKAQEAIDFLKDKKNELVEELAKVPMLLQIIAIIWGERVHLPQTRHELYKSALNYLLAYRDSLKEIKPVLPAEEAILVMGPVALWIQEEFDEDEVPAEQLYKYMTPILNNLEGQPDALTFCLNIRDRAGLIVEAGQNIYIFRHKSFQEFLAGKQLVEESNKKGRIESLIAHFKEDRWENTLRFFMSMSNGVVFDKFMYLFFDSAESRQLNAHHQELLQDLVSEAPQKKIDSLVEWLNSNKLDSNQKQYVLDCLNTVGRQDAINEIKAFIEKKIDKLSLKHAKGLLEKWEYKAACRVLENGHYKEALSSIKRAIGLKPHNINNIVFCAKVLFKHLMSKISWFKKRKGR